MELSSLNPQQRQAVKAMDGPVLILAGAGTGKTRVITSRVAYMIAKGTRPGNILAVTFTNKAAREMLDRVEDLVPFDTTSIWGGTFHSVGNRILRRHSEKVGLTRSFSIMDREDQKDLMSACVASSGVNTKEVRFPKPAKAAPIFDVVVVFPTPPLPDVITIIRAILFY